MNQVTLYAPGGNAAVRFACRALAAQGLDVTQVPTPEVTHLLLPVPAFEADGRIRGGGILEHLLADLPEHITVLGGNLTHPALQGYPVIDLLGDGLYAAKNAAITADCAIRVAAQQLGVVFDGCPILILGWGRIGKSLAQKLKAMGARVTVAARNRADRDMLAALGYGAEAPHRLGHNLAPYRVIFNTVPAPVLTAEQMKHCRKDCVKIELASVPGMVGDGVTAALGLPGKMTPESSGELIARTVIRLLAEREEGK